MDTTKRIYIVDDEEAIRRSLHLMLRMAGWEVTAFESGVHFLDQVTELAPACILLDVRMPDVDGLEVQQRLNQQMVVSPVVVMTGHGELSVAVAALRAGAVDFIEKPFEKSKLLASIERAWLKLHDPDAYHSIAQEAGEALEDLPELERAVLENFAQGLSNNAVSSALDLGLAQVELHRANLVKKLGGANLSDAIRVTYLAWTLVSNST